MELFLNAFSCVRPVRTRFHSVRAIPNTFLLRSSVWNAFCNRSPRPGWYWYWSVLVLVGIGIGIGIGSLLRKAKLENFEKPVIDSDSLTPETFDQTL